MKQAVKVVKQALGLDSSCDYGYPPSEDAFEVIYRPPDPDLYLQLGDRVRVRNHVTAPFPKANTGVVVHIGRRVHHKRGGRLHLRRLEGVHAVLRASIYRQYILSARWHS